MFITSMGSLRVYAALGAIAVAGAAHAFVIDDFTTGAYSVTLVTPGSTDTAFRGANVLGGIRTTRLTVESNPLFREITLDVGNHFAISDSGTLADSHVRVGYGYAEAPGGGLQVNELNLDLSGQSAFLVDFLANDLNNDVTVYIGTWNGSSLNLSTVSAVAIGDGGAAPSTLSLPTSGLSGTASLSNVDVLVFQFDNQASGDFALSGFAAVPEPASMMAIGIGITGLIARRRRNRKA